MTAASNQIAIWPGHLIAARARAPVGSETCVDNWMEAGGSIGNGVKNGSWRYGWAIDLFLGYP